jgi:hypothetical protein
MSDENWMTLWGIFTLHTNPEQQNSPTRQYELNYRSGLARLVDASTKHHGWVIFSCTYHCTRRMTLAPRWLLGSWSRQMKDLRGLSPFSRHHEALWDIQQAIELKLTIPISRSLGWASCHLTTFLVVSVDPAAICSSVTVFLDHHAQHHECQQWNQIETWSRTCTTKWDEAQSKRREGTESKRVATLSMLLKGPDQRWSWSESPTASPNCDKFRLSPTRYIR